MPSSFANLHKLGFSAQWAEPGRGYQGLGNSWNAARLGNALREALVSLLIQKWPINRENGILLQYSGDAQPLRIY